MLTLDNPNGMFYRVSKHLIVNQYRPVWRGEKEEFPDEVPVLVLRGDAELLNPGAVKAAFTRPLTEHDLEEAANQAIEEAETFIERRLARLPLLQGRKGRWPVPPKPEEAEYMLLLIPALYPSGSYRLFPFLLEMKRSELEKVILSAAEYLTNIEFGIYINLKRAL
ncbi:hypothetical protein phiFa_01 [Thermus phage phiFa]|nr:hypothetical protein phiFa_01 [Thermus phage phiFa]